jgi:hypothetical protein
VHDLCRKDDHPCLYSITDFHLIFRIAIPLRRLAPIAIPNFVFGFLFTILDPGPDLAPHLLLWPPL